MSPCYTAALFERDTQSRPALHPNAVMPLPLPHCMCPGSLHRIAAQKSLIGPKPRVTLSITPPHELYICGTRSKLFSNLLVQLRLFRLPKVEAVAAV